MSKLSKEQSYMMLIRNLRKMDEAKRRGRRK